MGCAHIFCISTWSHTCHPPENLGNLTNATCAGSAATWPASVFMHLFGRERFHVCASPLRAAVSGLVLYGKPKHDSDGSGGDKIKTCSIHSTSQSHHAALPTRPSEQTQPSHSGTWNASVNRAILALAPGTMCTYCQQPFATWEFRGTYGSLSLGNSLCQELNKLRAIPRAAINCLLSATREDTQTHACTIDHWLMWLTCGCDRLAMPKLGHWGSKAPVERQV